MMVRLISIRHSSHALIVIPAVALMNNPRVVRVGTRGSALALAQTALAIDALAAVDPDSTYEPTIIRTEGDRDKTTPLTVLGGQGVFTVALQDALLRGEVDIAVHSAKDVPPATPDGLVLAAFPERADPRDVFISRHGLSLAALPPGARVGTSSRRRAVQARAINPQIEIVELRGNLDTRLRKSTEPEYDGIIVAAAGLDRMGWQERITEYLPVDRFVPSPGQGALAHRMPRGRCGVARHARPDRPSADAHRRHGRARASSPPPVRAARCRSPRTPRWMNDDAAAVGHGGGRWTARTPVGSRRPRPPPTRSARAGNWRRRSASSAGCAHERGTCCHSTGSRVVVTRPEGQADALIARLETLGATVLHAPTIRIADPPSYTALDAALRHLPCYDWIVWTSANGVDPHLCAAGDARPRP